MVAFAPDDETVFCVQNKKKVHFYHLVYNSEEDIVEAKHFKSLKKISSLEGTIHSVISNDLEKVIFLVDEHNIYAYQTATGVTTTYKNHNI